MNLKTQRISLKSTWLTNSMRKFLNLLVAKIKNANGLDHYLVFSFTALIIYTIVEQILTSSGISEHSTLTTCFFAAFGGNNLSCVIIKVFKLHQETKVLNGTDYSPNIDIPDEETEKSKESEAEG